jgi:3-oxoacyl-[acyl-carrier-protein] synthase II
VIVGTAFGCQEANWQFDQFTLDPEQGLRGASPMAFKGTVDNAPAGWVAVAYRFKGVNATFVSGPGAGAEALLCGAGAIAQGRAPRVVAGGVERLISLQIAALEHDGRPPRPFAAEGSAMVVLERAELAAARGHRARGRLLAAARFPGGPASMARFIGDAGVAISALDAVSLATDHHDTLDELVDDLVVVGCTEQPLDEATGAGQMYAAGAPLSLMLLLHRLHRGGGGTGLLVATGEDGERFGFLVTTGE